jgi:hypothetical protein
MHYDARTLVIHQTFTSDNTPKGMPLPSVWVTVLNLAVVTARDFGSKTLLLERDFRAPSISRHFKVELESSLIDLLTSQTDSRSTTIADADTLTTMFSWLRVLRRSVSAENSCPR